MRILYSAIDQSVPSPHGGSVHVTAIADGLADLGHDVRALVSPGHAGALPHGKAQWIALPPPMRRRQLRLLRSRGVLAIAREFNADVIIERYYNFGGEGILAARRLGALAVLEVNAPVVDHPGSMKRMLDRALVFEPMRRWREWQCDHAHVIVTPSAKIIPAQVPSSKILRTEWGADTERFHPGLRQRFGDAGAVVAVFAGAFRAWHGAIHLVDAIRRLRARGRRDMHAVFIGDGPELPRVRQAAAGLDGIRLIGAVPHEEIASLLAGADIGVAPFDVAAHPALAHEFHWSPLKIFEYMAVGLPVVAPRIERLATIIDDGREGVLYDATDPDGLANALERLTDSGARRSIGAAARARVVRDFSWKRHCRELDNAIREAAQRRACAS
jgi:alpha-maltose-1-phosphate synthase